MQLTVTSTDWPAGTETWLLIYQYGVPERNTWIRSISPRAKPYICPVFDNGVGKTSHSKNVVITLLQCVHSHRFPVAQLEDSVLGPRVEDTESSVANEVIRIIPGYVPNAELSCGMDRVPRLDEAGSLLWHRSEKLWVDAVTVVPSHWL